MKAWRSIDHYLLTIFAVVIRIVTLEGLMAAKIQQIIIGQLVEHSLEWLNRPPYFIGAEVGV